jgi:hypothetical protein
MVDQWKDCSEGRGQNLNVRDNRLQKKLNYLKKTL